MMGLTHVLLVIGLLSAPEVQASQTALPRFQLEIATGLRYPDKSATAGETPRWTKPRTGTWRELVVGRTIEMATFMGGSTCGFITGSSRFSAAATFGWEVEATPITLGDDHAVVRIRWSRGVGGGMPPGEPPPEMLMRFRPGEEAYLDSTVLTDSAPPACRGALATLIVALKEVEPYRERVVSNDLWLVHRQPDGQERTLQVNVRGGFNQPIPFVFDDLAVGTLALDVRGTLLPRFLPDGSINLELSAERRWSRGSEVPNTLVLGNGSMILHMKPDDVTSISIPLTGREGFAIGMGASRTAVTAEAIDGHSLSLRVRSRQIR
jgi:hypothetical protein